MFKKLFYLFFTACLLCILFSGCTSNKTTSAKSKVKNMNYNMDFVNMSYNGLYSGYVLNNIPNGKGTLNISDGSNKKKITGTWENGYLDKSITITNDDSTYSINNFDSGKPYGLIETFSGDNKLLSRDWYYEYIPISELSNFAKNIDSNELILKAPLHYKELINVTGSVIDIIETKQSIFLLIKDSDNGIYLCYYNNTNSSKYSQAIVPVLNIGDTVSGFGYFEKLMVLSDSIFGETTDDCSDSNTNNSDINDTNNPNNSIDDNNNNNKTNISDSKDTENTESKISKEIKKLRNNILNQYFDSSIPNIKLVFGKTNNSTNFNIANKIPSKDFFKYPYHFNDCKTSLTGTVIKQVVDPQKNRCIILLKDNSKNLFYAYFRLNHVENKIPKIDDMLTLSGTIKGCYKTHEINKSGNEEYHAYPLLYVSKINNKNFK